MGTKGPYRLVWSRTQDFHSWNSGSNPDGVTAILKSPLDGVILNSGPSGFESLGVGVFCKYPVLEKAPKGRQETVGVLGGAPPAGGATT